MLDNQEPRGGRRAFEAGGQVMISSHRKLLSFQKKQGGNMSDPVSEHRVRAARHEVDVDLVLSKHGGFGPAICWLAFYALAVVSALIANFNQVIKTAMTAQY
jgi:hypothetical protein